jgi:hypothetical protein
MLVIVEKIKVSCKYSEYCKEYSGSSYYLVRNSKSTIRS